jgi:hypothetical protein
MAKFKIYAGLSGGFGGARYCGIYECDSADEAETYASEQAIEEYESYGGYHGLYTWDSMRQEIADDEYDGDIDAVDPDDVDMRMMEQVEGWLTYRIVPVPDNFPLDWDEDDDDQYDPNTDDDADTTFYNLS